MNVKNHPKRTKRHTTVGVKQKNCSTMAHDFTDERILKIRMFETCRDPRAVTLQIWVRFHVT